MTDEHDTQVERETLARVERALPRVAPPPDMFDRILAEVKADATVVPLRPAARRRWIVPVAAVGAIAAAVAIAFGIAFDASDDVSARAAISGKSDPAVVGEATITGSTVNVSLQSVPEPPSGHHYEVWVLPAGSDAMVSVGTFDTAGDVELSFATPQGESFVAVDVSVEEDGGPAAHSDTSLASGTFA